MEPKRMIILALALLLNLLVTKASESEASIQVTRFQVPSWVLLGSGPLLLRCEYQLVGESLHAMKLFKDDKEFYRYTPSVGADQKQAFQVPGILLDLERSNASTVWLRNVNRRSAGTYKCQISVEGTFRSVSAERRLEVRSSAGAHAAPAQAASGQAGGPPQRFSQTAGQLEGQAGEPATARGSASGGSDSSGRRPAGLLSLVLAFALALAAR